MKECTICYQDKEATTYVMYGDDKVECCPECRDKYLYDEERHRIKPHIDEIFNVVNKSHTEFATKAFIDAIDRQHRTLQQSFFKDFIVPMIKHYAELPEGHYDLRNEDVVKCCRKLQEILKDESFRYI